MTQPKILLAAFALLAICPATGQTPQPLQPGGIQPAAAPGLPPQASPSAQEDDRFPALRESADRLKAIYVDADTKNMADVESLLKNRRCQIARVGGLIDRTIDALLQWHEAERTYWKKWAEVEQQRVDGQQKNLATMEVDQERVKELIATETKDHEDLLRRKANTEKGKRTQEIVKEIDALVSDIQDSEEKLAQAQKQYDDVSSQVKNMNTSIAARIINMRQNLTSLESYGLGLKAFYEDKRKSAQEICNLKQPNGGRVPLPSSPKQTQKQP